MKKHVVGVKIHVEGVKFLESEFPGKLNLMFDFGLTLNLTAIS